MKTATYCRVSTQEQAVVGTSLLLPCVVAVVDRAVKSVKRVVTTTQREVTLTPDT